MNGNRGAKGSIKDRLISLLYRLRYRKKVLKQENYTIENKTKNIPFKFQINECEATLNKCSVTSYMQPDSETVINISAIWEQEGALDYVGMVDLITITVNAQQVD